MAKYLLYKAAGDGDNDPVKKVETQGEEATVTTPDEKANPRTSGQKATLDPRVLGALGGGALGYLLTRYGLGLKGWGAGIAGTGLGSIAGVGAGQFFRHLSEANDPTSGNKEALEEMEKDLNASMLGNIAGGYKSGPAWLFGGGAGGGGALYASSRLTEGRPGTQKRRYLETAQDSLHSVREHFHDVGRINTELSNVNARLAKVDPVKEPKLFKDLTDEAALLTRDRGAAEYSRDVALRNFRRTAGRGITTQELNTMMRNVDPHGMLTTKQAARLHDLARGAAPAQDALPHFINRRRGLLAALTGLGVIGGVGLSSGAAGEVNRFWATQSMKTKNKKK